MRGDEAQHTRVCLYVLLALIVRVRRDDDCIMQLHLPNNSGHSALSNTGALNDISDRRPFVVNDIVQYHPFCWGYLFAYFHTRLNSKVS